MFLKTSFNSTQMQLLWKYKINDLQGNRMTKLQCPIQLYVNFFSQKHDFQNMFTIPVVVLLYAASNYIFKADVDIRCIVRTTN